MHIVPLVRILFSVCPQLALSVLPNSLFFNSSGYNSFHFCKVIFLVSITSAFPVHYCSWCSTVTMWLNGLYFYLGGFVESWPGHCVSVFCPKSPLLVVKVLQTLDVKCYLKLTAEFHQWDSLFILLEGPRKGHAGFISIVS